MLLRKRRMQDPHRKKPSSNIEKINFRVTQKKFPDFSRFSRFSLTILFFPDFSRFSRFSRLLTTMNIEEKGRSNLFSLSKIKYFCEDGFSICPITFPKKGHFFDFVLNFLLLCSTKGLTTPFFRIYIHFCVQ